MFHVSNIKNWFQGKAADFNKIAEFLNNLCGKGAIHVFRPDKPSNGSPPTIEIDIDKLSEELQASPTSNKNLEENDGGDSQSLLPDGMSLDTTEWQRGVSVMQTREDDGAWVDYTENGETFLTGIRMQVVSRVVRAYDTDYFFWRWAYFDKNGCLYKLSAEQGVFAEVNYDVYLGE